MEEENSSPINILSVVPEVREQFAMSMAQAMYQALKSKSDAQIQIGSGTLIGIVPSILLFDNKNLIYYRSYTKPEG